MHFIYIEFLGIIGSSITVISKYGILWNFNDQICNSEHFLQCARLIFL